MKIYAIVLAINILLGLVCLIYAKWIIRLSGHKSKDEMFKYFNEKAFKNIGILLTITSGISIFIGLFIICTYSGNISHEEIRIHLMSDLKYLIIAIGIYLYNVIKLKITMNKSD